MRRRPRLSPGRQASRVQTMRSAGCASPAPPQFFVDPPASPDKAPHTPGSSTDGWKSETQDSFATPAGTSPVKRHNDRYYVDMSGVGTASNRSLPTAPVGKTGKGLGNQTHLQVPVSPFYRFCH
mmetsp:Transcript_2377/g.8270  ORF Transcript_2377/g.8270 Transcript_2377/m.8270 type:complete len:124 (-) Transcript_2377:108-479(-)